MNGFKTFLLIENNIDRPEAYLYKCSPTMSISAKAITSAIGPTRTRNIHVYIKFLISIAFSTNKSPSRPERHPSGNQHRDSRLIVQIPYM